MKLAPVPLPAATPHQCFTIHLLQISKPIVDLSTVALRLYLLGTGPEYSKKKDAKSLRIRMNFFETILLHIPLIFTLGRVIRLRVFRPSRLMLSLLLLLRFVRLAACPNTLETSRAVNCKRPFPELLIPHQTTVCPPAGRP